jgi:hypothetical protein
MTISIGHNRQHQEQDTERGHTNKKEEWKHRNLIRWATRIQPNTRNKTQNEDIQSKTLGEPRCSRSSGVLEDISCVTYSQVRYFYFWLLVAVEVKYTTTDGTVVAVIVWQLDLQLRMQSVPIITDVVSSNPAQGKVYNIMWYRLSVTCGRSGVFSGYSGFLH